MTQAAAPDTDGAEVLLGAFDWQARTRLVYGPGLLARLGELASGLGAKCVLLVTDRGIVAAGHAGHAQRFLEQAGLKVVVDDQVRENPTTRDVTRCVEIAREGLVDAIVGLGGGSSMDTAKGCNFILTNGGEMKDYWGVGKAAKPMLPMIAIPTTAGTGSECQSAALIADENTHQKMACLDPKVAPRIAILDPELTVSQPQGVTACTGVDALAHAVETAVTRKRTALSEVFSREAFRLCYHALPRVLAEPGDLAARGRMQLGAAYAGLAIENSMLGAAHSAANPLTAHHGVVHGQAVGLVLPEVVRFNAVLASARDGYLGLCASAGLPPDVEGLALGLEQILRLAGLAGRLRDFGVTSDGVSALAEEAGRQWTATFNPRGIGAEDFARIYETLR
jgi:alcohol dehydrogenase